MGFQYDDEDDADGPEGFAYDAGDYEGGDQTPEPAPVSQGSRRLTLPEWLRGVT